LKINPVIQLRTGINVPKCWPDLTKFKELTGYQPELIFKYELSIGYCIYISFGLAKDSVGYGDGTMMVTGNGCIFNTMRATNMMDHNFGIVGNLINCGHKPCIAKEPFAAEFCKEHNNRFNACDIVKYAKESLLFSEIDKSRIVFIEKGDSLTSMKYTTEDLMNCPDKKSLLKSLLVARTGIRNQINECDKINASIKSLENELEVLRSKQDPCFDFVIETIVDKISKLSKQVQEMDSFIEKSRHIIDDNHPLVILSGCVYGQVINEKNECIAKHDAKLKEFDAQAEVKLDTVRNELRIEKNKLIDNHHAEINAIDALISEINKIISAK